MNRHFVTPKGTELPLLNLKGRDYLEVKYRLVWFREDHPDWSIETNFVSMDDQSSIARAVVKDENGRIIATSHKTENLQGFPDFMEKSETGAIGRALALIGYGTQFCADELDEGSRIVDAPVARASAHARIPQALEAEHPLAAEMGGSTVNRNASNYYFDNYRIAFGKYRGKKLEDISRKDLEGYLSWLKAEADKKNKPLSVEAMVLTRMADIHFKRLDQETSSEEAAPSAENAETAVNHEDSLAEAS